MQGNVAYSQLSLHGYVHIHITLRVVQNAQESTNDHNKYGPEITSQGLLQPRIHASKTRCFGTLNHATSAPTARQHLALD